MPRVKRIAALLVILLTTVGCDQATKSLAQMHLEPAQPIPFLNGIFQFQLVENPGAFLSLGAALPDSAQRWIFTIAVTVILSVAFILALRWSPKVQIPLLIAFALFLGGGIGNLIDRVTNDGRVIDFMHIGIGPLRTGIFNVADMALMAGVALIAFYSYRTGKSESLSE